MGELAKEMVRLSGQDSVQGIMPTIIMPKERPEGAPGANAPQASVSPQEQAPKKRTGVFERIRAALLRGRESGLSTPAAAVVEGGEQSMRPAAQKALLAEGIYGKTIVVPDMYTRKRTMIEKVVSGGPGSGFIALTGGFGTLDELVEMVAMGNLGAHKLGVCMYNVEGFWDHIVGWMENGIETGFVREEMRGKFMRKESAEGCVEWLREFWGTTWR